MGLAENIKYLRKRSGLNQAELAEKIGVKQNSICCWEKKTRVPRKEQLNQIASLFKLSPSLLSNINLEYLSSSALRTCQMPSREPLTLLGATELKDFNKRKKFSESIFIADPKQENKYIEYPNVVLYFHNDSSMAPDILSDEIILIQVEAPYGENDIVVFHDTANDEILVRGYRIINDLPILNARNSSSYPDNHFIISGKNLRYIGKVLFHSLFSEDDISDWAIDEMNESIKDHEETLPPEAEEQIT